VPKLACRWLATYPHRRRRDPGPNRDIVSGLRLCAGARATPVDRKPANGTAAGSAPALARGGLRLVILDRLSPRPTASRCCRKRQKLAAAEGHHADSCSCRSRDEEERLDRGDRPRGSAPTTYVHQGVHPRDAGGAPRQGARTPQRGRNDPPAGEATSCSGARGWASIVSAAHAQLRLSEE